MRQMQAYLGRSVHVVVDRPVGYVHHGLVYPVNYGYIPGILGGDGEEQDAYILGVEQPLTEFEGQVVGIIYRFSDVEDKLVVVPEGMVLDRDQIETAVHFQEQFFEHSIAVL